MPTTAYSCIGCKRTFISSTELTQHETATGHNTPSSSSTSSSFRQNHPDRKRRAGKRKVAVKTDGTGVKCRRCGDAFDSRRKLYEHRMLTHSDHIETQSDPWVAGDLIAPWVDDDNAQLKFVYDMHRPIILRTHSLGRVASLYNFPLDNSISPDDLKKQIEHIFNEQSASFKINLSFGLILINVETGEYRYFTPYYNTNVFPKPFLVNRRTDVTRLLNKLTAMNVTDHIVKQRPDTRWKPFMITNLRYSVFKTGFPLGCGVDLPAHITNSRSIVALIRNYKTGSLFADNLCAFRCLAYHRKPSLRIEKQTNRLYGLWQRSTGDVTRPFKGVAVDDFSAFESCFAINVDIYELGEDGAAVSVYKSRHLHQHTMNLNMCNSHLSYITRLTSYCKKFRCRCCDKCFRWRSNTERHERTCSGKTKLIYPGGFYAPYKSVFDRLLEWGIRVDTARYDWFIVFDMESVLVDVRQVDTIWRHSHRPISVSVASNVSAFESERFYFNDDLDGLLTDMLAYMKLVGTKACELARARWRGPFRHLRRLIDMWRIPSDDDDDDENDGRLPPPENVFRAFLENLESDRWSINFNEWADSDDDSEGEELDMSVVSDVVRRRTVKQLVKLYDDLARYCQEVPVIGFNSAKYDLNVIKSKFAKHLRLYDGNASFTVKRSNSYMCVSNGRFRFLDIMQYLPPGTSYSAFLKTFAIEEEKSFFPYEWLDCVDKLRETRLPPPSAFWSSLKGGNTLESEDRMRYQRLLAGGKSASEVLSEMNLSSSPTSMITENYARLQHAWTERGMQTMLDFLAYYNNLDVGPFRDALLKYQALFFEKGVDIFKSCISAPGAARQMVFRHGLQNGASFALCGKQDASLYKTIRGGLVGGPSIIFHRHQKAGETYVRGGAGKLCRSITGFDSNALYLNAISRDMPVGRYVLRSKDDGFYPHIRDRYHLMYDWMDWLNFSQGTAILHKMNNRVEKRVGSYYLDGFDPITGIHYEFNGCYFHGHTCEITDRVKNDKWHAELQPKFWKRTREKLEFIAAMGLDAVVMWECDFRRIMAADERLANFVKERHHPFHRRHSNGVSIACILKAVRDDALFGLVQCDIAVPARWDGDAPHGTTLDPADYFDEMSPIFCNVDVPFDLIGEHMQRHVREHGLSEKPRRLLVGGTRAKRLLLATPLLKWYLEHGLVVTDVQQVIEYGRQRCFRAFAQEVTVARRRGDADPDKAVLATLMKLVGNAAYGSMIMNKERHASVLYARGQSKASRLVNDVKFRSLCELDDDVYEAELAKGRIALDLPIQLGFFVLQYAKMRMLEFYYDFLDRYLDRSDFRLLEMDTDSEYLAFTEPSLVETMKPEMLSSYHRGLSSYCRDGEIEADARDRWFPRTCCPKHERDDRRTPGLFHIEFHQGTEMIGLCSKTYCISSWITHQTKYSTKGVNKLDSAPMSTFKRVLDEGEPVYVVNRGMRARKNTVYTYEQRMCAFTYLYCKRKILADGVSTAPLDMTLEPPSSDETVDILETDNYSETDGH